MVQVSLLLACHLLHQNQSEIIHKKSQRDDFYSSALISHYDPCGTLTVMYMYVCTTCIHQHVYMYTKVETLINGLECLLHCNIREHLEELESSCQSKPCISTLKHQKFHEIINEGRTCTI